MFAISAVDAISPALQRTRTLLFRPFRLGTFLKLCLVAAVTEGTGNFNSSVPGGHTRHADASVFSPFLWTPARIAAGVAMTLLVLLLCGYLLYLVTRLRFAFFHCLIHNTREIRPGWALYRSQAARFFWLNVVVGFGYLLVLALILLPFAAEFIALFHRVQSGGHPDIGMILGLILPLIPIIIVLALVAFATDVILRDLMLPHFALEDASAGEAWRAAWARIRAEKGPFFAYTLLRIILPIGAWVALFIVLAIPAVIFFVAVVAVGVMIHAALADAHLLRIFVEAVAGAVAFCIVMLVGVCFGGPLGAGMREYALVFYGGRYQKLGDILYPPPEPGLSAPGIA